MFHVKHFEKLAEFARQNQIKYGEREQKQFEDLCSLLVEENKVMNLTAIEDPEEIEIKHFIDSLEAVPLLCSLWADLKIAFPSAEFVLMDSLNKRINFINKIIESLELTGISAIAARAEDMAKVGSVSRETFDFCVSRAVASLPVLLEYCLPFVQIDGFCILYKSGDYEEELNEAQTALQELGGKLVDVQDFFLPETDMRRSLLVIRKTKATPDKYPRRPGKPSKSPIR